jgi:hypothetical protein
MLFEKMDLCRICLFKTEQSNNIFSEAKNGQSIVEVIQNFASVEMQEGDGLPVSVCVSCEEKLNNFLDFRTLIIDSDFKLRQTKCLTEEDPFLNIPACLPCGATGQRRDRSLPRPTWPPDGNLNEHQIHIYKLPLQCNCNEQTMSRVLKNVFKQAVVFSFHLRSQNMSPFWVSTSLEPSLSHKENQS